MSAPSIEATPITEPLDTFLVQVIQTLKDACDQGYRVVRDDPASADRIIEDCKEIIGTIMAGRVDEWLS
jgi:hypothetical protein